MELEALQWDSVQGPHTSHGLQGLIRDAIRGGALSDAVDVMKEAMTQEVTPVLKRVQGIKVHTHVSTVKLDQQLADLESEVVKAEGLGSIYRRWQLCGRWCTDQRWLGARKLCFLA